MCTDIFNFKSIDWTIIILESFEKMYLQEKCQTGLNGNLLEVINSDIIYSSFSIQLRMLISLKHIDWC